MTVILWKLWRIRELGFHQYYYYYYYVFNLIFSHFPPIPRLFPTLQANASSHQCKDLLRSPRPRFLLINFFFHFHYFVFHFFIFVAHYTTSSHPRRQELFAERANSKSYLSHLPMDLFQFYLKPLVFAGIAPVGAGQKKVEN